MRELDEHNITDEVIRRIAGCDNARLKTLVTVLVRHLHAFAREVELTEAEWVAAIAFLTRTGQICDEKRQEFILLSDTLGLSTLVDAINNRAAPGATQSTVLGPFFVEEAPLAAQGSDIDPGDERGGESLYVDVQVTDPHGRAVPNARVDVWHSDAEGFYDVQRDGQNAARRARFSTGPDGELRFWTTTPASYPIPDDGPVGDLLKATARHPWRPAHVHFMIDAPGFRRLVTHVFVNGDPYLDSDAVFGVKESLIDDYPSQPAGIAPDGRQMDHPYRVLRYRFGLTPLAAAPNGD
jgi:hydroxyquinol 1,2-dioxygenase